MKKRYTYKAVDSAGKDFSGFMEASSPEEVGTWLADRQYFVLDISQAPLLSLGSGSSSSDLRISSGEMNYFFIQLASLINSGCPHLSSLQALHRQLPVGSLKRLVHSLKEKIESGKSFSEALRAHRSVFSELFITMVEVGEVGGLLDEILQKYAHLSDTIVRIKSKVIRSMIYPMLLLMTGLIVCYALLTRVFPVFVEQLSQQGHEPPLVTQLVMNVSNFLTGNSVFIIGSCAFAWFALRAILRTEPGREALSRILLAIPVLSNLVLGIELALFSKILGTLLKCGVPILTALSAVEKAHRISRFKLALKAIKEGVAMGETLTDGMNKFRDLFPDSLILMVDVGDRGGVTGDMLEKAGEIYERNLEDSIETAVTLIEPILVMLLGVFVFILAFAMYLPLFDITKIVG